MPNANSRQHIIFEVKCVDDAGNLIDNKKYEITQNRTLQAEIAILIKYRRQQYGTNDSQQMQKKTAGRNFLPAALFILSGYLTSITFFESSIACFWIFGMLTFRTPCSTRALIFSLSASSGRSIVCWNFE